MIADVEVAQTLASAAVTVLVGIVALLVGSYLTRTREHRKWLKEQRLDLYAALAEKATKAAELGLRADGSRNPEYFLPLIEVEIDAIRNLAVRLRIVGSASLSSLADTIRGRCENLIDVVGHPDGSVDFLIGSDPRLPGAIAEFVDAARHDVDGDGSRKARRHRAELWHSDEAAFVP